MEIETAATLDGLAADALTLLDRAPNLSSGSLFSGGLFSGGLFSGRAWWEVVLAHALPADAEACFVTVRAGGAVVALVPMLRQGGRLGSLTTPYSCAYAPLFAAEADATTRIAAMATLARFCRGSGVTRLDAVPAEWDGLPDLLTGVRQAGLYPLCFDHFGNWHEDVSGLGWSAYLRDRPGALRETIRRRLRRADALPEAKFELLTQPAEMDQAAEAFESVYRRSWKEPEPYPTFNAALMRAMAARGALRFGLWSIADEPVAVQVWVVMDRRAIVLKLAHDEAFRTHSPGTVLTALMLRHLLDREQVTEIDFGRGDDAYKQGWASRRRQRIGVLLVNPWRPAGTYALLRHTGGRGWTWLRDACVAGRLFPTFRQG